MKRSLIIGATGGVGSALAAAAEADSFVTTLSRSTDGVDLTDETSVADAAQRIALLRFHRIIVATGALAPEAARPERSFREADAARMAQLYAVNAIGPALVVKHFSDLLAKDDRAVFAFLSARVGSISDNRLGGWMSYRASKAALNQIVRCAAIELARSRPRAIVMALHPGTIETPLTRAHARGRYTASAAACARDLLRVCDTADASMSGGFFAYDGAPIPW